MTDLSGLIERVEAADEGDQYDVLVAAFEAIKGPIRDTTSHPGFTRWHDDWFVFERKLKAFAFLDAAMTLTEGDLLGFAVDVNQHDRCSCELSTSIKDGDGKGATVALAFVAASLRAQKEQANG